MKTAYAPESVAAYVDAAHALALAQPVIAYALAVAALAAFAAWAARFL